MPESHSNSIRGTKIQKKKKKSGLTSLKFSPPWKSVLHKFFKSEFLKVIGPNKEIDRIHRLTPGFLALRSFKG